MNQKTAKLLRKSTVRALGSNPNEGLKVVMKRVKKSYLSIPKNKRAEFKESLYEDAE